jgi:hypothetical protein
MELTRKNKERFEKWIMKSMNDTSYPSAYKSYIDWFYDLPISMQFGVIQDYADSYEDKTGVRALKKVIRGFDKYFTDDGRITMAYDTRDEARKAAIKAFDEIVNAV